MVTPGSALLRGAIVAIALGLSPVAAGAQCPSYLQNKERYTEWPDSWVSNWAHAHSSASLEALEGGDAFCADVLADAAMGLTNALADCGVWWVDPNYMGIQEGAMPAHIGAPNDTLALILINGKLRPAGDGSESRMGDSHTATPYDSVGTREVVTHEALHASFEPIYFGRELLDAAWETNARDNARLCSRLVHLPDIMGSSVAGLRGALAAIIAGIMLAGWGIARRRRIAAGD